MTYITIKTKETNANVEIFPPIVLDGRSHISLVEEEELKKELKVLVLLIHKLFTVNLVKEASLS